MFNNLLESKAKKTKRSGSTIVSFLLHGGAVIAMVVATANAGQMMEDEKQEKVEFVEVKPDEPPPEIEKAPPPPDVVAAPPIAKGFQVLTPPDIIPLEIPEIDLSRKVTDEADFSGRGVAGGIAKGVEGGVPQVAQGDTPYFEFQVEKPAAMAPGSPGMQYPEMLRSAQVEGTVLASFEVDTMGRANMSTFKVLRSDHELFTNAVKNALPRIRYLPAEIGGRKVRQLVQQPFVFSLAR
jgi:periplasmic protein TonB